MPKVKTKRAAAKRFKVTGTGKLKRMKAYKSHILTKKSAKEKVAPQVALVQLYYKRHARFSYKMSYYSYSLSFPIAISHICKPYRSLMR